MTILRRMVKSEWVGTATAGLIIPPVIISLIFTLVTWATSDQTLVHVIAHEWQSFVRLLHRIW